MCRPLSACLIFPFPRRPLSYRVLAALPEAKGARGAGRVRAAIPGVGYATTERPGRVKGRLGRSFPGGRKQFIMEASPYYHVHKPQRFNDFEECPFCL